MQLLSSKNSKKIRTQWTRFCFTNKANYTNPKTEKKWQTISGKIDSSEDIFHISFNHSSRNCKSLREKYWKDVSVNLSENKTTATEAMMQKPAIYLLEMSNHIFNLIFKILQYAAVASLCWYVYFKFILNKTRLIFAFWGISRNGKRIYSFWGSYFPISPKTLDQNNSLTTLWNNNWKL